jgi:hypothetical protein
MYPLDKKVVQSWWLNEKERRVKNIERVYGYVLSHSHLIGGDKIENLRCC